MNCSNGYIHESFVFVIHMWHIRIYSVLPCDKRLYSLLQATTKYLKTATQRDVIMKSNL